MSMLVAMDCSRIVSWLIYADLYFWEDRYAVGFLVDKKMIFIIKRIEHIHNNHTLHNCRGICICTCHIILRRSQNSISRLVREMGFLPPCTRT